MQVSSSAVRAWVKPDEQEFTFRDRRVAFRKGRFGDRALFFDTETTTGFPMKLMYGFFCVVVHDQVVKTGVFTAEDLPTKPSRVIQEFATARNLEIMTRGQFVDKVFYPEVYGLGALCVGFNLPFDLAQIAIWFAMGRGRNRHKTTFTLTRNPRWPRIRIEPISGKAAFIGFAPKKHAEAWEKPLFKGRFLDLSTLTTALTGERHTLRSAGHRFHADALKSKTEDLGKVTPDSLRYAHQDVLATRALYDRLRDEYLKHPFSTLENELHQPKGSCPITRLYSTASVGKRYLGLLGYRPLLETQPDFDLKYLGYASSAYFGGRAEARIRRLDVPVTVLDFTSMYPTVFILQNMQAIMSAKRLDIRDCTAKARQLLEELTLDDLIKPSTWPRLPLLVRVRPNCSILPVRFRASRDEPYEISVTPFTSSTDRWYTFADALAAKLLGGGPLEILEAIEFVPVGRQTLTPVKFQGGVEIDPDQQIFRTVVEERQRARKAGSYAQGLKQFAASAAYGINFEINVRPSPAAGPLAGNVYSDVQFHAIEIHDEGPGRYCNPIIATFVTGGARLLLAMLEQEVVRAEGTFAFADTDSLAVVSGNDCPDGIGCLTREQVLAIQAKFDQLNPYDPALVPHLLKIEYEDVRCWAVSAKRYVLFQKAGLKHFRIVKASESGLGGIIGRTKGERTFKLARRIWLKILTDELSHRYDYRLPIRASAIVEFDGPQRRKLPLTQPEVLRRFSKFNKHKKYVNRVKPFSLIQTVVVGAQTSNEDVRPVAPFVQDVGKSRALPWVDITTKKRVNLDWMGAGYAGTVPVMGMAEFLRAYATHPEKKAADEVGNPCVRDTRGLLGRLWLEDGEPARIGKEIDRLYEEEDVTLDDQEPIHYRDDDTDLELEAALEVLKQIPQTDVASEIGISERRLRDIEHGRVRPRKARREAILWLADEIRSGRWVGKPNSLKPSKPKSTTSGNEDSSPWAGLIVFGLLVTALVGRIAAGNSQPLGWPIPPNED